MDIKSVAIAGAIAFAATIGAASAAELSTLKGISAEPMNVAEMAVVRGSHADANALPGAFPGLGNPGTGLVKFTSPAGDVGCSAFCGLWFGQPAD